MKLRGGGHRGHAGLQHARYGGLGTEAVPVVPLTPLEPAGGLSAAGRLHGLELRQHAVHLLAQ